MFLVQDVFIYFREDTVTWLLWCNDLIFFLLQSPPSQTISAHAATASLLILIQRYAIYSTTASRVTSLRWSAQLVCTSTNTQALAYGLILQADKVAIFRRVSKRNRYFCNAYPTLYYKQLGDFEERRRPWTTHCLCLTHRLCGTLPVVPT